MKKIAIAALLSAGVAAPAFASNCYDGIKVGQANYPYSSQYDPSNFYYYTTNNNQPAYGVLLGCNISPGFAVEAEYNLLGGFDVTGRSIKGSSFGMSAVGFFPMSREFSLFGKLGLANTALKDSPRSGASVNATFNYNYTGVTLGFGGQFNVSRVAGIRFGYDVYEIIDEFNSVNSVGMFSVGGIFKF